MMKSIIHRFLAFIYIFMVAICILFTLKPGASIFYYKKTIDNQDLKPDFGFAYRYHLITSLHIFRTQGMLLYEDEDQLTRADGKTVIETGKSTYTLSNVSDGSAYIYFSSSDNSDPITNGRKYTIYLPMSFISSPLGVIYLFILLPGLICFLYFALIIPEHRKTLVRSPVGILTVLDDFFELISQWFRPDTDSVKQMIKARVVSWRQLFTFTTLASFFYVFMEWLFLITMPSFMSIMSIWDKVEIFLLSSLFISILSMAAVAVFIGFDLIMIGLCHSRITIYLGVVIPTVILLILALLMIDNFTYTVFKFGISTSTGILREFYRLFFVFLFIFIYIQMLKAMGLKAEKASKENTSKHLFYFSLGILVISTGLALTKLDYKKTTPIKTTTESTQATEYPNIIFLGSDGLSAENLSVYGYSRDTTPRLRELALSSLIAENAFPNSSKSAGSVVSMMTSKLPSTTRVGSSFEILKGIDAFQHLPGILKYEGYKTVEFGVRYYVDAYSFNMQNGYDWVNNRSEVEGKLGTMVRKLGYDNSAYFLDSLIERISDRILHIFFFRKMQNSFALVTKPADNLSDQEKIDQMLSLFDNPGKPLFVHMHLMGTHGAEFSPLLRVFSNGEQQDQPWMIDFYDDAILSFDHYVGEVIDYLQANGQFDNTILIIYTDHDPGWSVAARIPLIIRFPEGQFAGTINPNIKNMDIAPTLLDYLDLPKPTWMSGESLLQNNLDSHRLIFSLGTIEPHKYNSAGKPYLDPELKNPPFYQFGFINVIECQKWYLLNLKTLKLSSGDIPEYKTPCTPESLYGVDDILKAISNQLSADGFDISSLYKTQIDEP
ncbi:MAG: hypothetical protein A2030_11790 [Chloroflexi bacterium RBG_19FT_COMBO_50_10]|nr:MAG: hypothetical protein A2030_11790 [Chloroflexi bacterium RBG_19FT_COMBO_50_10]